MFYDFTKASRVYHITYTPFFNFSTYSSLPVDTSVSLKFSPLRFPAITICNMNPVMVSKMDVKELLKKPVRYSTAHY